MTKLMLEQGGDINIPCLEYSSLIIAVASDLSAGANGDALKHYLERGASPHVQGQAHSSNAPQAAVRASKMEMVELILA